MILFIFVFCHSLAKHYVNTLLLFFFLGPSTFLHKVLLFFLHCVWVLTVITIKTTQRKMKPNACRLLINNI